jgi:hypothetical protein
MIPSANISPLRERLSLIEAFQLKTVLPSTIKASQGDSTHIPKLPSDDI